MTEYERDAENDPDEQSLALCVFRQSKGSDDSASLAEQRERVPEAVAAEADVDATEALDMGVHTGYSRHNRAPDEQHVEASDDYMDALNAVESGRYDVVAAYDENRLARDKFIERWEYAAERGDAEFVFVESNPDDALAAGVKRVVEREAKKREIAKARRAIERRQEAGFYQGDAPFGFRFDARGEYLEPDEPAFSAALDVIDLVQEGDASYRSAIDEVAAEYGDENAPSLGAVSNIIDRSGWYIAADMQAVIGNDGPFYPE